MTEEEQKLINLLKNGSSAFKEKATGIFKNMFAGSSGAAGFSASRIITGGVSEADIQYNKMFETRRELLKSVGEAGILAAQGFDRLEEASLKLFGTTEKAAQAQRALSQELSTFAFMTAETRQELGETTMILEQFGVSMGTTGEILDSAAMAFGMSQEQLSGLARELATVVYKFPGQASDIARNFKAAQSSLAYDSEKIMGVFKKLQHTSSTTGVSFNSLTSAFGESMDTFEGSASKAVNLNAILGRSVFNSIDLLGKTEAERVDTIVQGVQRSIGGAVNRLGKFQLKAVAEGMGLTVEETRRLLTGQTTVDDVLKNKAAADPKKILQEQANEAMKANTRSLDALRTEFKAFQTPFEQLTRFAETTTRNATMNTLEGLIKEFAPRLGVDEDALNNLKLTTISDATDKLLGIMAGISPLLSDQEERLRLMRGQQRGDTKLTENAIEVRNDILQRLKGLENVVQLPASLAKQVKSFVSGEKTGCS